MKNHTKAVLASVVVLALAVSSVGATYSWFSDTAEINTNVRAASIDVDFRIIGDDGSGVSFAAGEREYSLRLVNHSTIAVSVEPSLEVVRHYAALNVNGYVCDVKRSADQWEKDVASSSNANNGTVPWSGNDSSGYMISASFGGSAYDHFVSVNSRVSGAEYEDGGTNYDVYKAVYSISSGFMMEPGEVRDIQLRLKVDSRCSIDSDHMPRLYVTASQVHAAGSLGHFPFTDNVTISKGAIAGYDSLEFSCSDGSSVILDHAATDSDWDSITVSLDDSSSVKTIKVQAEKGGSPTDLDGWIHYRVAVDRGVTGVMSDVGSIPVVISGSGGTVLVDFIDQASNGIHRISYA